MDDEKKIPDTLYIREKSLESRPKLRKGAFYTYVFPQGTAYYRGIMENDAGLFLENVQEEYRNKEITCGLTFEEGKIGDARITGVYTCDHDVKFTLMASYKNHLSNPVDVTLTQEQLNETCAHPFIPSSSNMTVNNWNAPSSWVAWEPPTSHDLVTFSGSDFAAAIEDGQHAVAAGVFLEWAAGETAPRLLISPGSELTIFGVSESLWKETNCLDSSNLAEPPAPKPSPPPAPQEVNYDPEGFELEQLRETLKYSIGLRWARGAPDSVPARTSLILEVRSDSGTEQWRLIPNRDWIEPEFTRGRGPRNVSVYFVDARDEPGLYPGSILMEFSNYPDITESIEITMEIVRPTAEIVPTDINQVLLTGTDGDATVVIANAADKRTTESLNELATLRFSLRLEQLSPNTSWASIMDPQDSYELPPESETRIQLLANTSELDTGSYAAKIYVDADTYAEPLVISWNVRVALYNICPRDLKLRMAPGEVTSRTISVSNLSPQRDIFFDVNTESLEPWVSVVSSPALLPNGSLPRYITISIYSPTQLDRNVTSFDLSGSFFPLDQLDALSERAADESITIELEQTTGTIDGQQSFALLNVTAEEPDDDRDGSSDEVGLRKVAKAEIWLLNSAGEPLFLGGAIPDSLHAEMYFTDESSRRKVDAPLEPSQTRDGLIIMGFEPNRMGTIELNVVYGADHVEGSPAFATIDEITCEDPTMVQTSTRVRCHCKAGFRPNQDDDGQGECIPCEAGFFKSSSGNVPCDACGDGQFSRGGATSCRPCPRDGAVCDEGTMHLEDGFWREPKYELEDVDGDVILHECRVSSICTIARNQTGQPVNCGEGHKGTLCDTCEQGYAKDGDICKECTNRQRDIAVTALLLAGLVAVVLFIALKKKDQTDPRTSPATLARLTLNWLQVCALLSEFSIQVLDEVRTVLSIGEAANGGSAISLHSVQCVLQLDYFSRFYIVFSLPVVAVVAPLLVVGCLLLRDKLIGVNSFAAPSVPEGTDKENTERPQSPFERYRDVATSATVALLFLCYNTVLKFIVSSWDFYPHEIDGKLHLRQDFSVTDDDPQYHVVLVLSLIGTVLYLIGIPLLGIRVLGNNRRRLSEMTVRRKYGFLFEGYRRDKFLFVAWEIIVLIRKTLLSMIVVLVNNGLMQLSSGLFVLFSALILHQSARPFLSKTANRLESSSLFVLISTAVAALVNHSRTLERHDTGQFAIAVVVIVLNAAIAFAFAVNLIVLSSKRVKVIWHVLVEKCTQKAKKWTESVTGGVVTEEITDTVDRLIKGEKVDQNTLLSVFNTNVNAARQLSSDTESLPKAARKLLADTARILEKQNAENKNRRERRLSLQSAVKAGYVTGYDGPVTSSLSNPLAVVNSLDEQPEYTSNKRERAKARWKKLRVYVKTFGALGMLSVGEQKALERENKVGRVLAAAGKSFRDDRSKFHPEVRRKMKRASEKPSHPELSRSTKTGQ